MDKLREELPMSRHSRAMLLNVLWHHQGGSSIVGQAMRSLLNMGQFDDMNEQQVAEAKWIDGLLSAATSRAAVAQTEPVAFTDAQIAALRVAADALVERYAAPIREILSNAETRATPPAPAARQQPDQCVDAQRRAWQGSASSQQSQKPEVGTLTDEQRERVMALVQEYGDYRWAHCIGGRAYDSKRAGEVFERIRALLSAQESSRD
jgi:hypothetical protein